MLRLLTYASLAISIAVLSACGGGSTTDDAPPNQEAATTAALSWLDLVDAGEYDESWITAADLFKSTISEKDWNVAASNARQPLGRLVTRKLQSATYQTEPQGETAGEYVVTKFGTAFENFDSKFEIVTARLESDKAWRVSGYFIR